jgi:hypothetical protein
MTNKSATEKPVSQQDLRKVFESCVEMISKPQSPASRVRYGVPIASRLRPTESSVDKEKQAISSAARALAMLWKVPAHCR